MCRTLRCAGSVCQACSAAAILPKSRSQKITVNQSLSVSTRNDQASVRGLGLLGKTSFHVLGLIEDRAARCPHRAIVHNAMAASPAKIHLPALKIA